MTRAWLTTVCLTGVSLFAAPALAVAAPGSVQTQLRDARKVCASQSSSADTSAYDRAIAAACRKLTKNVARIDRDRKGQVAHLHAAAVRAERRARSACKAGGFACRAARKGAGAATGAASRAKAARLAAIQVAIDAFNEAVEAAESLATEDEFEVDIEPIDGDDQVDDSGDTYVYELPL